MVQEDPDRGKPESPILPSNPEQDAIIKKAISSKLSDTGPYDTKHNCRSFSNEWYDAAQQWLQDSNSRNNDI